MLGFRVWDSEEKRFILFNERYAYAIDMSGALVGPGDKGFLGNYTTRYIPMQSTGLKDMDNKEIFQEDIIKSDYNDMIMYIDDFYLTIRNHYNFTIDLLSIPFNERLKIKSMIEIIRDCQESLMLPAKIIGNTLQNPELLEKVKC